ncbi:MAG: hypothetical protein WDA27_02085 [Actinomycetota bacterium]
MTTNNRTTSNRYPGGRRSTSTGPGPGAGTDRDPERASMLSARIAIVATIVIGQLWGLTVALNAALEGHRSQVWVVLGIQAASFVGALVIWLASPRDR